MSGLFKQISDTLADIFSKDMLMMAAEIGGILAVFGLISGFFPSLPFGQAIVGAMSSDPNFLFVTSFCTVGILSTIARI